MAQCDEKWDDAWDSEPLRQPPHIVCPAVYHRLCCLLMEADTELKSQVEETMEELDQMRSKEEILAREAAIATHAA